MTCGRLSTRILGVVFGAASVERSMSFTLLRNARVCTGGGVRMSWSASTRMEAAGSTGAAAIDARQYADFIKEKAKFPNPPQRLSTLLLFLQHKGLSPVDPADRAGLNPFLVPLVKDDEGVVTGLLRWPTSPETLEMPVVRNGETGLELLANNAEHFIRRTVAEADFVGDSDAAELIRLANEGLPESDPIYEAGAVEKLGRGVMKYHALRVGQFPDVYEWLTASHLEKGDFTAALASAERANEIFVGWGRPYGHYARVLAGLERRDMEAKDAAKVALRCPCWTISPNYDDLEKIIKIAGYEDMVSVRAMYVGMADDEQTGKITEGKAPMQVALDRAAHLMDAVAFGHKGWDGVREELAERYEQGGLPEIASFVRME